jgi:hypothetical protein
MALGDGDTWDESNPTNATFAVDIDDYNRDLRVGVRKRMEAEHEWPDSQSSTSEAGMHKFITLQAQTTKPPLSGTQIGAVYFDTANNLMCEKSDGTEVVLVVGTAVGDGKILVSSTDTTAGYLADKIDNTFFAISGTNLVFSTSAIGMRKYTNTNVSTVENAAALKMCFGSFTISANDGVSISNLPFTTRESYRLHAIPNTNVAVNAQITVSNASGALCSVFNHNGANIPLSFIGIGV